VNHQYAVLGRKIDMEISLFDAALKGFLNLFHLKVFLAMMIGVSIGTFTAVAPQGLGMPLVYAIALPVVIKWKPITGIALLIGDGVSRSGRSASLLPRPDPVGAAPVLAPRLAPRSTVCR
jgi:hypothetical protein